MLKKTAITLTVLTLALAGCGTTKTDRAVSGAGLGAGAGAAVGALTGMSVATGAALGAIGGAATGALTDADTVNLGDPVWRRNNLQSSNVSDSTVAEVQRGLSRLGYDVGGYADGVMRPQTRTAIRQYQEDYYLVVNGQATPELARHINAQG